MPNLHRPLCHYRPMTVADVDNAHALSAAQGWAHRREEWAMLQRVAEGFVAEADGRLIGSAFACHQGGVSTIGLVIVSQPYQGKGIGGQLMERALHAVGQRTALLNATAAGAPLYRKLGFQAVGQVEQHQGHALVVGPTPLEPGKVCRALNAADAPPLLALANAASGMDRAAVFDDLRLALQPGVGIEQGGQLQAFACLRPFGRGRCIGPVIAQHIDQAKHMIAHLLGTVPGAFVRIDVSADHGLGGWLNGLGLEHVETVTRMAKGQLPRPAEGVQPFALISQAIG